MGRHGAAHGYRRHANSGEYARTAEHQAFDRGAAAGEGSAVGGPGGAIAALVHPQKIAMAEGGSLQLKHHPLAPIGHQLIENAMEHTATLAAQLLIGGGAPFQILPELPGFVGWRVAVQHLVARRRQGGIQPRRHRQHHHVALSPDAPLPIPHPHMVDRQLGQAFIFESQVPVQKTGTSRRSQKLLAPALRRTALTQQGGRIPWAGITNNSVAGVQPFAADQAHPRGSPPRQFDFSHRRARAQLAPMAADAPHQGVHHGGAAT